MMGFLLRMKNDQVQRKALRVNGRDNGFVYALGHQILMEWLPMPQSLPICLSFWLLINILICEKQVIDFKQHISTELCSHLLYGYLTSTKPSEL